MIERLFQRREISAPPDLQGHFRVNDSVRLDIGGRLYFTRVEESGADGVWVAWPAVQGIPVSLDGSQPVILVSGCARGMQGFLCEVVDRSDGEPPMLKVRATRALGRVQHRDFVRVPDSVAVTFTVLTGDSSLYGKPVSTWAHDISGGGLRLNVHNGRSLRVTDRMAVDVRLPGDSTVHAVAEVVWVGPMPDESDVQQMAVCFTEIREEDRKRLIKRVFARQAQLRKAGLL